MDRESLKKLLYDIKNGTADIDFAIEQIKSLSFEDINFAKIDHHRSIRNGFPEVVYCEGKAPEQIKSILEKLLNKNDTLLLTRADKEAYNAAISVTGSAIYHETARLITVGKRPEINPHKFVAVVSAGTSDIPVAEEAAITCETMGNKVSRIYDVGVAGIHRLLAHLETLTSANVLIVVAGMEGALASVVGGLVDKPVIAVPTSIGYGANFGGLSALLCMLNSCASGVSVVNIDNGFGAGYLAGMINKM